MVKKRLFLDLFITSASQWKERLMMGTGSTNGAKCEEYATLVVDLLRLFLSVIRLTRHAVPDFRGPKRAPNMEYLMVSIQGPNMKSNNESLRIDIPSRAQDAKM
jgi:hypothetical protein